MTARIPFPHDVQSPREAALSEALAPGPSAPPARWDEVQSPDNCRAGTFRNTEDQKRIENYCHGLVNGQSVTIISINFTGDDPVRGNKFVDILQVVASVRSTNSEADCQPFEQVRGLARRRRIILEEVVCAAVDTTPRDVSEPVWTPPTAQIYLQGDRNASFHDLKRRRVRLCVNFLFRRLGATEKPKC